MARIIKSLPVEEAYNPKGIHFYEYASGREMLLVEEGHMKGWLCYRHPGGQWVTLREATEEDKRNTTLKDDGERKLRIEWGIPMNDPQQAYKRE